jgi:SNF2 family DNA or RNA helicase
MNASDPKPNLLTRLFSLFPADPRWGLILFTYLLLLLGTGYIAFFQETFNPALNIGEDMQILMQDENTRQLVLDSLKSESSAFMARRELAIQSFNIVLGAALGFLSAAVVQARGREQTKKE